MQGQGLNTAKKKGSGGVRGYRRKNFVHLKILFFNGLID